ncbi:hypothetical protein Aph01nite_05560 [Acrocarpospora phusangensis]|uniref:Uncharacterized protein n=1 Tax=Acrocarpospora phusangensis TaxID=1070424 RepID=A0A919UI36_9ACTN|nr:hypothetical protein [Acrocarpospora phusangensis]GIH22246.1 hypothetical protein Aph01nite_05560 [Acrocarpospora phusangensis]
MAAGAFPGRGEQAREVLGRCLGALEGQGASVSASAVARRLGRDEGLVRKVLNGERPLRPEFVRDLGVLAGVPVAELFQTLGWLPEDEVLPRAISGLADGLGAALRAFEDAQPYLAGLTVPVPAAPFTAAQVLLGDPAGAERFDVRLAQVVSPGRYRTTTATLAEFSLRPGQEPLPAAEVERLAAVAGISAEHGDRAEHDRVRLELRARIRAALNDGQEYSWQGDPGHRTWRSAAQRWPTHLLVQDAIGGRQLPAGARPATWAGPATIVMIGGRHGTGPAAALLAEALGWRFVLVRPNLDVTRKGHVLAVPAGATRPRARSWQAVASHIAESYAAGTPWPAVVLVRPAVFGTPEAVAALRDTPARVVYARPPAEYLHWWGARIEGDHRPGEYDGAAWAGRVQQRYAELEHHLADRIAGRDLLLRLPAPARELPPHLPELPGEVMDQTVRVAWTALRWLAVDAKDTKDTRDNFLSGRLRGWQTALETDPDALLPRLTDLG